jgi:lysophospholipase L1-like esterase
MIRRQRGLIVGACAAVLIGCIGPSPSAAASACAATAALFRERSPFSALRAKLQRGEQPRILAIGSSSTAGVGASSPVNAYPSRLQENLKSLWHVETVVLNAGLSGEVAAGTLARLQKILEGDKPDLVIWQLGTNDALKGEREEDFRAIVEQGVDVAARAGVDMILMDPQYAPKLPDRARYERYVTIVDEVGAKRQVSVFSRYALMRGWAERAPTELAASLSPDGLHLSDHGYDCLADLLAERLHRSTQGIRGVVQVGAQAPY